MSLDGQLVCLLEIVRVCTLPFAMRLMVSDEILAVHSLVVAVILLANPFRQPHVLRLRCYSIQILPQRARRVVYMLVHRLKNPQRCP